MGENKNTNDMEDLNHDIEKSGKSIERMEEKMKTLEGEIDTLNIEIGETKDALDKQLDLRNNEVALFRQALKEDADGVQILTEVVAALKKFYKKNKIPLELRQKKNEPEYTNDPDKAPETIWDGGDYGGRKGETTGIVAILGMLREDLENEMKIGRQEDDENQAEYEKGRA